MESEKLEDLLLLSLSASKGQRERSEVLDVGVTRDKNLREVIVKYSGDIDGLQIPGMEIQKLLAGYAIVKLPEDQIGALVAAREIEYVEMPKNLQTGLYEAKRVSCILPLLPGWKRRVDRCFGFRDRLSDAGFSKGRWQQPDSGFVGSGTGTGVFTGTD